MTISLEKLESGTESVLQQGLGCYLIFDTFHRNSIFSSLIIESSSFHLNSAEGKVIKHLATPNCFIFCRPYG